MKKQKENSREGITWSEMGKQNVQAEKVYYTNDSYSRLTKDKTNQDFSLISGKSIQNSFQVFWSRYSFFLPYPHTEGTKRAQSLS